jgi:hypothetical protein
MNVPRFPVVCCPPPRRLYASLRLPRIGPIALAWLGVLAVAGEPPATAPSMSTPESFNDPACMANWTFSNGPEWPGAQGRLERSPNTGRGGDGALVLHYDFRGGGNYVAASTTLPTDRTVTAARLWVHKPADNLMTFRATDRDGETFQKSLRFDYRGWQQLEITFDGWVHSWGGDGRYAAPPQRFDILIENQGNSREGELRIDDVQWVYEAGVVADTGLRIATYTETTFADDEGWTEPQPPETGLRSQYWSYRFTDEQDQCSLTWGRSVLGQPVALRLTVEADRSGHELRAVFGSHFQNFERALGTLDTSGPLTLEVPLGDMRTWSHHGGEDDGIVRYPLRLEKLVLKRKGTSATGAIALRQLEFVTRYDPARPVTLIPRVERIRDLAVFTVEARSLHEERLSGELRYTIRSVDRVLERGSRSLPVPALGRCDLQHVALPGDWAAIEGVFEFSADGIQAAPCSVTLAQIPATRAAPSLDPNSRIGAGLYLYRFHGKPDYKPLLEQMCTLAAAAGVKWTREEFHWNWIEPQRGQFDFAFFDDLVETATAHGISVYGLLCYYTEWNRPPVTDEFIENYCRYVRTLVRRYKHRIRFWEIWNEPNIFFWPGPKERYAVLLKRAYEAIKEEDPTACVLGCSTAGIDTNFIRMVLDAGAPFDALTIHPYRGDLDPAGFIRELREVRELVGGRDVWITEMGWSSEIGGLSEREQAAYVARTYTTALASGAVRNVAWYDFREDGTDPFYNEHHFGLVRHDLTPKMGFRALATAGELLGNITRATEQSLGDGLLVYAFQTAGAGAAAPPRHVLALWSPHDARLVRLKVAPPEAAIRNLVGEPAHCVRADDTVTLQLERNVPVYVTSSETISVAVESSPLELRVASGGVHPGESLALRWRCASGLSVGDPIAPPAWSVRAADNGVDITPPDNAPPGTHTLLLPVNVGGAIFEMSVPVSVVPALLRG